MSTVIQKELHILGSNCTTYLSLSGLQVGTNTFGSEYPNKDGTATFTDAAKNAVFPTGTAVPYQVSVSIQVGGTKTSGHYVKFLTKNTGDTSNRQMFYIDHSTTSSWIKKQYALTASNYGALNKSSLLWFHSHYNGSLLTGIHVGSMDYDDWSDYPSLKFIFYYNRYNFSAVAGANVSSASVSSSTAYDGDSVTYSCVLASGATFDGWYNGSTRVSTSQTYTLAVSGADTTLEARATASTTKTLSATYNGSQLSGFPVSVQADTTVSYNGSVIATVPFAGGTKTLNCANKIMNGNVTLCGKTLNCKDKVMASNVVVSIS